MKKLVTLAVFAVLSFTVSAQTAKDVIREDIEWLDIWGPHNNDHNLPRVLLIGDSITRQYNEGVEKNLEGKAYVERLATSKSLGDPVFLDEVRLILKQYDFDIVHVNNGLHGSGYTSGQFAADVPKLYSAIRSGAPHARIIWATNTVIWVKPEMKEFAPQTQMGIERNNIVLEFLADKDVVIDDLFKSVGCHPEYYIGGDGAHLNPTGIDAAAKAVADCISEVLAKGPLPAPAPAQGHSITTLEKINGTYRLVQDGKPFLMLSGELHNSSSSTLVAAESSFKAASQMGMNSVIATVSWEQLEPREGHFDFSEIDNIISLADKYDLRVAVIWFGSWKNGESSYPPEWVKADVKRFERVQNSKGENTTQLSPFCKETLKADSNAYRALMEYIAKHDTNRMICVMQVENEVGTFEDRDHTKAGEKAYASTVPAELMSYLSEHAESLSPLIRKAWGTSNNRMKGTWAEVFGNNRDGWQVFMAWYYAKFVEEVARVGKEAHPIPMYANAWLSDDDDRFGIFPNGGPRQCVIDIWKAATKYLDWVSPDVYHPNKARFFDAYDRDDNPLFIPEVSRETGFAYLAFGEYDALGYAPFGYEELYNDVHMLGEYRVLGELLPYILENQGTGRMHGFARMNGVDAPDGGTSFTFGDNIINVRYIKGEASSHGLIIQTGENEFLVAGTGAYFTFSSKKPDTVCKLSYAEEVEFDSEGRCNTLFVLNGDETSHHNGFYLRGRTPNPDFDNGEFKVDGPLYRPSYQRKDREDCLGRYKVSGIYKIRLYSYPLK